MLDLIEALQIFVKYESGSVTCCEHDTLYVCVSPDVVSEEDKKRLEELSFEPNDVDGFTSTFFGSC